MVNYANQAYIKQFVQDLLKKQSVSVSVTKSVEDLFEQTVSAANKEIEKLIQTNRIPEADSKELQQMTNEFIQLSLNNVKAVVGNRFESSD